jgi:methylthioxylose transferase
MHAVSEATAPRVRRLAVARPSPAAIAVGAWAALIVVAAIWGRLLLDGGTKLFLNAPPLLGEGGPNATLGVVAPLAVAGAIVYAGPSLAQRLGWRALLAACVLAAALWPAALALTAGPSGIAHPLVDDHEYLSVISFVHSPGEFLSTFIDRIDAFSTHVRSHPPGMALIVYGLDRAGLGGSGPAAALIVSLAASAPAAALLAARSVAGEATARRAAPFLVLAPAAIWIATSADALYMAVGAWAVALIALSVGMAGRRSDALAAGGGLLFGVVCFLSFGLVLLAAIPLIVAAGARRARPLAFAAAGTMAVALGFLATGYWWLDGFAAAREQYLGSVAMTRPYGYFLLANLAALALAAGPALAIALARLRDRRLWLLVGGGMTAVALADLSGMSKGEVERIWLPFLPWIMLATAALPRGLASRRRLLAAQAAVAVAIQVSVATVW